MSRRDMGPRQPVQPPASRYEQSLLAKQQKAVPESRLRMQPKNATTGSGYGQHHEAFLPPTANSTLN